jgi:ChrR Cupin-like domain
MSNSPENPNNYCFCDLAPLFSLGVLTAAEQQWVEQQAAAHPDLAAELAQYQLAVTAIPYSAETAPLAANVKERLFDRLHLDLPTAAAPTQTPLQEMLSLVVRSSEWQWLPHPHANATVAILHRDPVRRELVGLLQAPVNLDYPAHRHAGPEEIYMLSGDLQMDGTTYYAGDYIRSAAGSDHGPATSIEGCMFFFRSSMDDEYPN